MSRDNSCNDRKTFKRQYPGSDCFKNRHDPFYSYFGKGDLDRRKLSFSLWPLLSMVEEQLSETETHSAQLSTCLTTYMGE